MGEPLPEWNERQQRWGEFAVCGSRDARLCPWSSALDLNQDLHHWLANPWPERSSRFSSLSFKMGKAIPVLKDARAGAQPHWAVPSGHLATRRRTAREPSQTRVLQAGRSLAPGAAGLELLSSRISAALVAACSEPSSPFLVPAVSQDRLCAPREQPGPEPSGRCLGGPCCPASRGLPRSSWSPWRSPVRNAPDILSH